MVYLYIMLALLGGPLLGAVCWLFVTDLLNEYYYKCTVREGLQQYKRF